MADKYQMPMILLIDKHLADYNMVVESFDFSRISIDRYLADEDALGNGGYKRFKLTEDEISPRLILGKVKGQTVLVSSDEHDEKGHITESSTMRVAMVNKRMKNLEGIKGEIEEPILIRANNPEYLIFFWGSTYGAVKRIVERLVDEGVSTGVLVFGDIWPLPIKMLKDLAGRRKT